MLDLNAVHAIPFSSLSSFLLFIPFDFIRKGKLSFETVSYVYCIYFCFVTQKQRPSLFRKLVGAVKTQGGDQPAITNGEQPNPNDAKKDSIPPTDKDQLQKVGRDKRPGMASTLPRIDSSGSEGLNAEGHSRRGSPQTG